MAKPHQRVFALIMALLFFATAIAGGAAVVWQMRKDSQANKATNNTKNQQQLTKQLDSQKNQTQEDKLQGTKLTNFTPTEKVAELQSTDTKEGTGEVVQPGVTVVAHYTGAVAKDGVIFQSSHDSGQPATFPLSGVIKGWTEGVPGMKVGGIRRLLIPAAMAYGATPPAGSGIPADADLVFDIEIVGVQP